MWLAGTVSPWIPFLSTVGWCRQLQVCMREGSRARLNMHFWFANPASDLKSCTRFEILHQIWNLTPDLIGSMCDWLPLDPFLATGGLCQSAAVYLTCAMCMRGGSREGLNMHFWFETTAQLRAANGQTGSHVISNVLEKVIMSRLTAAPER